MRAKTIIILLGVFLSITALAQQKQVREGNKLYEQKKYKEAAAAYQQSLQKNPTYIPGAFNLGNALFQQKNFDGTRKVLGTAEKAAKDKNVKADANYNIGNTYMHEQKWPEAVDAYKRALRNNPQDEAAKYNLSYALLKMKQQQNNGGGGKDNKDQKDKQDQKQDQQQQNKDNKGEEDKKDPDNKPQENKDQQEQEKPQPQPSKLSKEQADQLLDALAQEEKKLHDKKEKGKGTPTKLNKDW